MKKNFTLVISFLLISLLSVAADLTVTGNFPENSWNNANASYKMSEIGTTGIYTLEKTLPAGTYEYKVFYTGTWNGATNGDNRKFVLDTEKTVKFYAKDNGSTTSFFCNAQQLYIIGAVVGGWDAANLKLMTNAETEAAYTAEVVAGNYKIVVKDKNDAIVWDDITPTNQTLAASGNFTIKLDYATMATSTISNGVVDPTIDNISNSYLYVGSDPTTATWYNASATAQSENFHNKNLGSVTTAINLGAEILTGPVMEGVIVKMHYQINELDIKEVVIPFDSNNGTTTTKWKSATGTNVFTGYSLTKGTTYSLKVWFSATEGTTTLWDSNNMANYVATFTYDLETNEKNIKSEIQIVTENGLKVYFPGNAQIELFNFNGQKIHSEFATGEFSREIGKGAYILKINNEIFKLMIK